MKQETLEEFKKRFANHKSNKDIKLDYQDGIYYGIEVGAKWQQEQDKNKYSEEDVLNILDKRGDDLDLWYNSKSISYPKEKEWFEQFKKK